MSDTTTNSGDNYYYVNGKRVPLVQEPGVFAVRYRVAPRLLDLGSSTSAPPVSGRTLDTTPRTLGQDLSPVAKRLIQDNTADAGYISNYNIQVYRTNDAGQTQAVLGRENVVAFATPVFKRSPDSQSSDSLYVTNQFLAQFKANVPRAQIDALCKTYNAQIMSSLPYAPNGYLFEIEDGPYANRAVAVANAFFESGLTIFAHPNFVRKRYLRSAVAAPEPTAAPVAVRDAGDGQYLDRQWHLDMAHVTDAWQINVLQNPYGSPDIVIAILDDGVDTAHADFVRTLNNGSAKIAGQYDFATNSPDANPKRADDNHGTSCAGVATAWGKAYGSAPGCRLLIARTPDYLGVADEGKMFQWAADNGADIISCSWGPQDGVGMVEPLADSTRCAIHYCVTKGRGGKGIPIFWAAGNGNESLEIAGQPGQIRDGYAGNPDVMAIAASTSAETIPPISATPRAYYSDYGPEVCVCAPSSGSRAAGEKSIFTTDRHGADGYNDGTQPQGDTAGDYTSTFGGTSSAAPLAAGIGALILSANPGLAVWQVRKILQDTADHIGPVMAYDSNGHSDQYGYGRVNAKEAVLKAMNTSAQANVDSTTTGASAATPPVSSTSQSPSIQKIGGGVQRSDPAPKFNVNSGQNRYYVVEFATRPELFDGNNHGSERGPANFYGSWQDNLIFDSQNTSTYSMPDAVWTRLQLADSIYYRVGTTSQSDGWVNYKNSTPDENAASAPSFTIDGAASASSRNNIPTTVRDATSGAGTTDSGSGATDAGSGSSGTSDTGSTTGNTGSGTTDSGTGSGSSDTTGAGTSSGSGSGEGVSTSPIHYDVALIPQPDKLSCWAGSMAMLVSYQQQASRTPESLAAEVGRSLRTSYGWDMLESVKDHFGFQEIALPSNATLYPTASQWHDWLDQYGPLWVTTIGAPSHAIVVRGISGDMTLDGTQIEILNPWDTSQVFSGDPIDFSPANNGIAYTEAFRNFASEFGDLGLDDYGNWRVLYLPGLGQAASSSGAASGNASTPTAGGATTARVAPGTTGTQAGVGGYTVYQSEVRVGGTLAWRNNNPGNIRPSQFTRDNGSIGQGWGFAVFPDEQTGFNAIIALLKTSTYQSKTIKGAIFTYAPPSDNNNSDAYVAFIRSQTGLDPERNMSSLSDDELNAVAGAIRKMEGWTPGTSYTCSSPNLPAWVGPLLGCGSASAPRMVGVSDRIAPGIAASLPRRPLRPEIVGPESYDRNDVAPSFHITLGDNGYYGVEVTTDSRLFDFAGHKNDRMDSNFFASWEVGLQKADGDTTYTLPEVVWARLKQTAFLYYRAVTSSRADRWMNTQTSLQDVLASRARAIRLTGHAGARLNTTAHHVEEELWNPDLMS